MNPPQIPIRWLYQLRRFLLFLAVAFSFGGFSFYAGVVVPIGSEVLDATTQGFVTRKVTHVINAASGLTLVLFLWEAIAGRAGRQRWENRLFVGLIVVLTVCLVALVVLHPRLDSLLNLNDYSVAEPERFYELHRAYLWISTMQWIATFFLVGLYCVGPVGGESSRDV